MKTKKNLLHLIILCTLNLSAFLSFGQNDKKIKILQSDSGDLINSYEDLLDMDPFDELIKLMEELKSEAQVDSNLLIIAKSVQFNNQFQNMVLGGNVELIHNDMFISSEEVSAKFSDDGDLLVLEAKDDVYLKHNNRTITCEILSYHPMNKKIKTQGSSSIEVKGNLIKAEQISGFISPNGYLIFEPNVWLDITQINNQSFGIDIRSEKAIFRNSNQEIRFDHKVRLRGDYGALNCNKLTLKLGDKSYLDWILAEEKVTFKYRDIVAKSSNMRYNLKIKYLFLNGRPRVMQNTCVLKADSIKIWPYDQKVICEPSAKAIIFPDTVEWGDIQESLNSND